MSRLVELEATTAGQETKQRSLLKILLCGIVIFHLIKSIYYIAGFSYVVIMCSILFDEANFADIKESIQVAAAVAVEMSFLAVVFLCLLEILFSLVHILMASFALCAEYKKKPDLFFPWTVYLNIYFIGGTMLNLASLFYLDDPFLSVFSFAFWIVSTAITYSVTLSRKAEMEKEILQSHDTSQLIHANSTIKMV